MGTFTWAGKLHVAGMIIAAVGVLTLFVTGVAAPQAFIGIILLVAIALLILFGHWRWTTIVGSVLSLFFCVTAVISPGFVDRLSNPTNSGAFVGTTLQIVGLLVALLTVIIASLQNYRTPGPITAKHSSSRLR
ncbi:MAG: hypothetical protein H0U76_04515 [Ktedonobacteraceae bacterium]|nr:hypothetical protein [Ktedonobacteraceae bacterium]